MFVCICAGLTEEDLKKAIADGHNTLTKLMYETGASLGCSMCLSDVERIVIEANKCGYHVFTKLDIPLIKDF